MGHLTHDEFFAKLADLFNARKTKAHGAVYLTQKRFTFNQEETPSSEADPFADLHPARPLPILIRATNGKSKEHRAAKVKLSTVVQPQDLDAFYARYAEVCKVGMAALKPRDRTKRKAKAKKRKVGAAGLPTS
ncbi:putative signal recognition particle 14kD protein [Achaetomium macrosporum]|uniref:Signal recognition particle subunit SRP14 n=1 Tax=Achaetomium macrosporum TaxID=79813 RepID=A0AAN7C8Y0_9PEZI|nr:putative signal recognition particle 14kD protein [Achaetomium macrosporum]